MRFIEKHYKKLAIVGFVFIALVLTGGLIFGPFNEILPESWREKLGYAINLDEEITVTLLIDFDGYHENLNVSIFFAENETATAFTILLKANLTVETKEYPNGLYIEGIEGVMEEISHHWWYSINDGDGWGIASDRYDLRANNVHTVLWSFKQI